MSFDPRNTVTVLGTGTITAVPDVARLRIAVEHARPAVGEALAQVERDIAAATAAARELGLGDRDIASGRLSLHQQYGDDGRGDVRGYVASQQLTFTVRDLPLVGRLVPALGESLGAALRVENLGLEIAEPAPLLARARELAMTAAREQAQTLASLAGRELGQAIVIDTGAESPREDFGGAPMMRTASFAPEAGEQDVQATIRVSFALV